MPTPTRPASTGLMHTGGLENKYLSPYRVLVVTILSIFLSELIAMSIVSFLSDMPYLVVTIFDGLITVIVVFPLIYYFSFRSLIVHINERERAELLLENQYQSLQNLNSSEQKQRQLAAELKPDIVLMDISMPEMNGIEATGKIKEISPQTQLLAMTVHEDESMLREIRIKLLE